MQNNIQIKGGDMSSTGFFTYQLQKTKDDYNTYLTTRLSINQKQHYSPDKRETSFSVK